ncbi:MAG: hypothetical protein RLZZ500_1713 [Bacteroidota bacterium]|jgi:uncharacterized membrane protein YphA (DoxX/SURF4 family)
MKKQWVYWIIKLTAAIILLQTLFFKFSGASESIFIFQSLGIEPYGRIGSGIVELIAGVFLMLPKKAWLGALLATGSMIGALFSHIFILGIEVQNDGGTLFVLAMITLICSSIVLFYERNHWVIFFSKPTRV